MVEATSAARSHQNSRSNAVPAQRERSCQACGLSFRSIVEECRLSMSREFMMPSAASTWSHVEVRQLHSLVAERTPIQQIAKIMRRSESAIRNKAAFHGISLRGLQYAAE